jgi:hypothetical protein
MEHKDAQKLLTEFYKGTLKGCWKDGRKHVDDNYTKLYVDFHVAFPQSARNDLQAIDKDYSVSDFIGYLGTWAGYKELRRRNPLSDDPLEDLQKKFRKIFPGDPKDRPLRVVNNIFMLLGRHTPKK